MALGAADANDGGMTKVNTADDMSKSGSTKRRRRGTTKSRAAFSNDEPVMGRSEAEEMMKLVQGHIVEWPYDW